MVKRNTLLVLTLIVIALSVVVTSFVITNKEVTTNEKIFSELPDQPDDFVIIRRAIETGETTNICNVKEEYYKHPEFYPTWEQNREVFYDDHDYSRWGVHGYGAYPADSGARISNLKEGESIDFCTFVKTSYGIETFQGVKMVFEDNEYFDIEIMNQQFTKYKNHFIMYPTFPEFHNNWSRQLHIRVTAKQNIPTGEYKIGFNFATPNRDFNEEMVWDILMQDTDEDIEYVKECVDEISESKSMSDVNTKCEDFMMQRQKKYVKGGTWSIGRDMYTITLDII